MKCILKLCKSMKKAKIESGINNIDINYDLDRIIYKILKKRMTEDKILKAIKRYKKNNPKK